ncbi:unnamed protein product [Amoebophrya sp. A120]|nr:unnamed protein product [Amoebophrya sp. A120]|eukprot:GSA120T00006674001.1
MAGTLLQFFIAAVCFSCGLVTAMEVEKNAGGRKNLLKRARGRGGGGGQTQHTNSGGQHQEKSVDNDHSVSVEQATTSSLNEFQLDEGVSALNTTTTATFGFLQQREKNKKEKVGTEEKPTTSKLDRVRSFVQNIKPEAVATYGAAAGVVSLGAMGLRSLLKNWNNYMRESEENAFREEFEGGHSSAADDKLDRNWNELNERADRILLRLDAVAVHAFQEPLKEKAALEAKYRRRRIHELRARRNKNNKPKMNVELSYELKTGEDAMDKRATKLWKEAGDDLREVLQQAVDLDEKWKRLKDEARRVLGELKKNAPSVSSWKDSARKTADTFSNRIEMLTEERTSIGGSSKWILAEKSRLNSALSGRLQSFKQDLQYNFGWQTANTEH